jgi:tetratricopeptide (TPR) repeat protein
VSSCYRDADGASRARATKIRNRLCCDCVSVSICLALGRTFASVAIREKAKMMERNQPTAAENAACRALRLYEAGRHRAAVAVLTVAICRSSDTARLWRLRGVIHHAMQQWKTALADVEHAQLLAPLCVESQLVLADGFAFTGRAELAVTAYEHLLTCGDLPAETYATIYRGLLICQRRDLAIECCRAAVRANPDDHAAYFAMAHCMAALRYSATFIAAVLEKAVEAAPDRDVYRVSLALQLTRCRRLEEAYAHLCETPIQAIETMACACSMKLLVQLCEWAEDSERGAILSEQLGRLMQRGTAKE